jgi:hypothetical protein
MGDIIFKPITTAMPRNKNHFHILLKTCLLNANWLRSDQACQ